MKKYALYIGWLLVAVNVILSAWYVIHGDLLFYTDIARDFLLFADIVYNRHLTLIGPRSGGIPGVFHGPLWLYINLPAFILGHGDPVVVGWFWVALGVCALGILYYVARRLFAQDIALLSIVLLSAYLITTVNNLFNPFGAVILSPLFFYFLYRYLTHLKATDLVFCLLTLGLIIQFQMAFGVPILVLLTPYLLYFCMKKSELKHLWYFLVLLLPLSSYILFEVKHGFLQTNSVLYHISGGNKDYGQTSWSVYLGDRLKGWFLHGFDLLPATQDWVMAAIIAALAWAVYAARHQLTSTQKRLALLFFYLYTGFWLLTFLFRGVIWSYYYWPFLPMSILLLCSLKNTINRWLFGLIYAIIFGLTFAVGIQSSWSFARFTATDGSSWKFNVNLARSVYDKRYKEFGYYIYTPDLFGYSQKYAFAYVQRQRPDVNAAAFQKKPVTFLVLAPPPEYRLSLKGDWWKKHQVHINSQPTFVTQYPNGFSFEEYHLPADEQKIPADPNLLNSLLFR